MCELYGRRRLYQICNLLFLAFNIACGEAPNLGCLLAFRFLAGCAGVAPLTIGAGSIADLMVPEQRGSAMALFSLGPLLGPIIGERS
jgi:predicted MFS family arabinose efflux permease